MDLNTIVICFLLTNLLVGYCREECENSTPKNEIDRLKTKLLNAYDCSVNPKTSSSSSNSTQVYMYLSLRRFTFMESYETLDVYYGMSLEWLDDRLNWHPSDFGNLLRFSINYSSIWTPKVGWRFMDTDDELLYMGMIPCLVYATGWVTCISWSSFHASCRSDLTHWPYDSHICEALLAPWLSHSREMEFASIHHAVLYPQYYQTNTEWAVLNAELGNRSEVSGDVTFEYPELTLTLQRHSTIYEATTVIPALVLVVLTLAAFRIEPECPTRPTLLCTIAVCQLMYLQSISMHLNNRGSIYPFILAFYRDSMLVCGLSLLLTLVVRWMTLTPAAPPTWMFAIAIKVQGSLLGRLLFFFQHPQQVADTEGTETSSQMGSNWSLIGRLLDRISFITFSVMYVVLLLIAYS